MSTSEDRQTRIADWLDEKRPDLASMHRTAGQLLASKVKRGDERARVSLICHSMREVMKHLPEVISGGDRVAGGPRSDDYVRQLPSIVSKYPALDLSQDAENVPVPQEIARFLADLIKAAISEDGRFLSDIAAFLTDDGNTQHLAVREWYQTYNFFVKWAHLHGHQSEVRSIPSDDELRRWIEVAEAHMDGVRAQFFDSLRAIEDLLAEANQLVDGGVNDG
ncbi:hypothetical protein ACX1DX_00880 [Tessaracoccus sp. Y36]